MSDNKIEELEGIIAHQEKQISDLNEIVTRQWDEIDAIKTMIKRTRDKMNEVENQMSDMSGGEPQSVSDMAAANKPPHY